MHIGGILQYILLTLMGVIGSRFQKKRKIKRFGKLIGIGKLLKPRFPRVPFIEFLFTIIYNIAFILISTYNKNNILIVTYSIILLLISIYLLTTMIKERNIVYIYENGIEINQEEILKKDIDEYKEYEPNKYIIERNQRRIILYEIVNKSQNILKEQKIPEVLNRIFPEIKTKSINENIKEDDDRQEE